MHSVYKLVDPRNHEVRYIGMTNNPRMRYLHHLQCSDGLQAKGKWIHELLEAKLNPLMDIIESHEERHIASDREKHWIVTYQKKGARLFNVQHGMIPPLQHKVPCGEENRYFSEKRRITFDRLDRLLQVHLAQRNEDNPSANAYIQNINQLADNLLHGKLGRDLTAGELKILDIWQSCQILQIKHPNLHASF